jgi:Flp pilus assembly protein TadB
MSIESGAGMNIFRDFLFLAVFLVLLIVWVVSRVALHLAGGLVHLILIIAIISLIIHFVRRGGSRSA